MPLRLTGLGSNQDADDYRDQAVDRERERDAILGYCSWHNGWFNRETGERVHCIDNAVTHGICPRCMAAELEKSQKISGVNPHVEVAGKGLTSFPSLASVGTLLAVLFLGIASASVSVASETGNQRVLNLSDRTDASLTNNRQRGVESADLGRAAGYLAALGQLESGNNDFAKGRANEISRYQCLPRVWREATALPYSAATNPETAKTVVRCIIWNRTGFDLPELTPRQVAVAWHCPNAKHLNREQRDYVTRFENLLKK